MVVALPDNSQHAAGTLEAMRSGRREQMLQAAYEIVGREGIEGLHARSVAQAVGVNHAAVHYYFAKRSDLILALVEFAFSRFAEDRAGLLRNARTPQERVASHFALAKAYSTPGHEFSRNWASFFVSSLSDDHVRTEMVRHLREWTVLLGMDMESAKVEVDVEMLVATMVGMMLLSQCLGPELDATAKIEGLQDSLAPQPVGRK